MSGKQWWPLSATADEARQAITQFQDRLRERKWLRDREDARALHIAFVDGVLPIDHLPSVNDLMRFAASDGPTRHQERVAVLRLLCMLLKWHLTLRPGALLTAPPAVFTIPNLEAGGYQYGLIALLRTADQPRPFSLLVSERDLAPGRTGARGASGVPGRAAGVPTSGGLRVRHWAMPQSGDSRHWMTVKTWLDQRGRPAFGKWVFGSPTERRAWLETLRTGSDLVGAGLTLIPVIGSPPVAAPREITLPPVPSFRADVLRQSLGGAWWQGQVVLPEFWDARAALEVAATVPAPAPTPTPASTPASFRQAVRTAAEQASQPPPDRPPEDLSEESASEERAE